MASEEFGSCEAGVICWQRDIGTRFPLPVPPSSHRWRICHVGDRKGSCFDHLSVQEIRYLYTDEQIDIERWPDVCRHSPSCERSVGSPVFTPTCQRQVPREAGLSRQPQLGPPRNLLIHDPATRREDSDSYRRGISRAIALRFAQEGATVVVADVREDPREGGKPTHKRIRSKGSTSRFVRTDVSDTADLEAVVAEISEDRAKEWISSAQSQA